MMNLVRVDGVSKNLGIGGRVFGKAGKRQIGQMGLKRFVQESWSGARRWEKERVFLSLEGGRISGEVASDGGGRRRMLEVREAGAHVGGGSIEKKHRWRCDD
ncbi:unnamed protein product [Lactuca virosa]|uniref:Uncharacterized protein n=1 Tax=Lactuca virosa TaxID=75947 RepID=A0AAU9LQR8_9ASTR|nr:unnamed protein product [Lactuca virosa]